MEEKVTPTIGIYAAILNKEGKLLLIRRQEKSSIIPGKEFQRDLELPGGGIKKEETFAVGNETIIEKTLARLVKEKTGLEINISAMPAMYPVVLAKKYPEKEVVDFAFVMIVQIGQWQGEPKRETMWVSPAELRELAEKPKGDQLLSGWGKRMCRMALMGLRYSINLDYSLMAQKYFSEIIQEFYPDRDYGFDKI